MSKSSTDQLPTDYPFELERHHAYLLAADMPWELAELQRRDGRLYSEPVQAPYSLQDPRAIRPHLATYVDSLRERFLKPGDLLFPPYPCWETLADLVKDAAISLGYKRWTGMVRWNAVQFVERRWKKIGVSIFVDGVVNKMTLLPRHPLSLIAYEIAQRFPINELHGEGPRDASIAWWADFHADSFSVNGLINLPVIAILLRQASRAVDRYLADRLSTATKLTLSKYQGECSDPAALRAGLVQDLNRIIRGPSIYDAQRFQGVALCTDTRVLIEHPAYADLLCLNRSLLEDAYPLVLLRHPREGVLSLRLNPTVRNSRNVEVANLVKIFDLVDAQDYPVTVPGEEWVQYYELIRRLGLVSRPLGTLIEGLRIKTVSRIDHDVVRTHMKSLLGFAAVLDLQREQRIWERRFLGGLGTLMKPSLQRGIMQCGMALMKLGAKEHEARLSKVIYPWGMRPTEVALKIRRALVRRRQLKHRAKADGTLANSR